MTKKFIFLDSSLVNQSGHAFEYDLNIADVFCKNKWLVTLFANKYSSLKSVGDHNLIPWFTYTPTDYFVSRRLFRPIVKIYKHWKISGSEIKNALSKEDSQETLFFIQHAESYQLPGIIKGFSNCQGKLLLMLRSTSLGGKKGNIPSFRTLLYLIFLNILSLKLRNRLIIVTDSERLKSEFSIISLYPINIVPIPSKTNLNLLKNDPPIKSVLLPGRVSFEKGIHIIPALIKEARRQNLKLLFNIHIHHPKQDEAMYRGILQKLVELAGHDLKLITEPLTSADYWDQLMSSNFILLIYDRRRYRNQTSGILIDSYKCGAIPVVTSDTWLSDVVSETGCGITISATKPEDVVNEIIEGLARAKATGDSADDRLNKFKSFHTADNFYNSVEALTNSQ